MATTKTNVIRDLNDRMRKGDATIPGKMIFTTGLLNYAIEKGRNPAELVALVRDFDAFSDDNDPHKEHDFGNFNFEGLKVYWKFDYYDPDLIYGSNDPSDPAQTFRVLTVFLASEY